MKWRIETVVSPNWVQFKLFLKGRFVTGKEKRWGSPQKRKVIFRWLRDQLGKWIASHDGIEFVETRFKACWF